MAWPLTSAKVVERWVSDSGEQTAVIADLAFDNQEVYTPAELRTLLDEAYKAKVERNESKLRWVLQAWTNDEVLDRLSAGQKLAGLKYGHVRGLWGCPDFPETLEQHIWNLIKQLEYNLGFLERYRSLPGPGETTEQAEAGRVRGMARFKGIILNLKAALELIEKGILD